MPARENRKDRLKRDEEARRKDPHGLAGVDTADEDEPAAWPSSDRQKLETTVARIDKKSDPRAK